MVSDVETYTGKPLILPTTPLGCTEEEEDGLVKQQKQTAALNIIIKAKPPTAIPTIDSVPRLVPEELLLLVSTLTVSEVALFISLAPFRAA